MSLQKEQKLQAKQKNSIQVFVKGFVEDFIGMSSYSKLNYDVHWSPFFVKGDFVKLQIFTNVNSIQ